MNKLLIFSLLLSTILYSQTKDISLVLPWKHQFQFAGYYVAKEMGFYEKAGLDVHIKEYDLKRDNIKGVSSGKYDFGVAHSSLILDKLNKYPNITLLMAAYQSSPLILLSKKRKDITSLKDIVGKTIKIDTNEVNIASINAMLHSADITANDYNKVDTNFNNTDILDGTTDLRMAYLSNEPYNLLSKGIEYTIFNPKDYGYSFYSDFLFTSAKMIKDKPKDVKAFFNATMKGWKYTFENIDKTADIILKKYNTQNKTKKALIFEASTLKKLAFIDNVKFGNINQMRLKETVTTYRLLGLVNNTTNTNFKDFIYKSHIHNNIYTSKNEKRYALFVDLYNEYDEYINFFILILLISLLLALYFRYKVKSLLEKQRQELDKNIEIFDKNISSSKTDIDGNIISVSKAFCEVCGYSQEELLGNTHAMLKDNDTPKKIYKNMWQVISNGDTWSGELKNIKKDGSEYWVKAIISPIFDNEDENIIAYKAIRQDITLKKVLKEFNEKLKSEVELQTIQLRKLATTDKLTGLYNRVRIDQELIYNYESFIRYQKTYSIILIDIDYFKRINDNYGHLTGDNALQRISSIMQESIRSTDIIGRWGGEEFMIISPNTNEDGAYKLAEKIRLKVESTSMKDIGNITISIGIAQIHPNQNTDYLINKADEALYRAKNNGRNRVEK